MLNLLRFVALFLGLLVAGLSVADAVDSASLPELVNRAARQRMLSQRAAKAWLMQATQLATTDGRTELSDTVRQFEDNLHSLEGPAGQLGLGDAWAQENRHWLDYRKHLEQARSKDDASALLKESVEVLRVCDQFVSQLSARVGTTTARRVALSGLQRMLSQRVAKAYLAQYWQVPDAGLQRELDSSQQEFDSILSVLLVAPDNDRPVREKLSALQGQWRQVRGALREGHDGQYTPKEILVASGRLLGLAEALTQEYKRLGAPTSATTR